MTQCAKWEIELPIDPFCMWVIYQIQMTQFQIDRASPGPEELRKEVKARTWLFSLIVQTNIFRLERRLDMAAVLTWEPLRQGLDGFSSEPEPKELSLFPRVPELGKDSPQLLNTRIED